MYPSLNPSVLGLTVGLEEGLALASRHGFVGYHFELPEAATLGAERVLELASAHGLRLAASGFPVEFREDEARYRHDLAALPALAQTAAELGVSRTSTWIMPFSDERTYRQNFAFNRSRLEPAAEVLAAHGIRLGLEYIGPKTMWTSRRYPFAHTMTEMLELCAAIGPNVGLLLDSFHWHTAHETAADLRALNAEQIVDVHLNDAPAVPTDEQQDRVRELPGATGVIDIATFLTAIRASGYDGPVMVEPFSERLKALPADQVVAETAESLKKVLER